MADILVVDDDESMATAFHRFLRHDEHDFRIASDAAEAERLIAERRPNVVIMDIRMPGRDGLQALQDLRSRFPDVYVVMMTAYGTSQTSIDAIRAGAFDYLTKPLDLDQLRGVIAKALAAQRVRDKTQAPGHDAALAAGVRLVGETPAMHEVYKMIGRLATNDVPALITGERGTGKQLVTRTIHDNSARASRPYVSVDGAMMPDADLEAALTAPGTGTLHVAAIERMSPVLQARLARALSADRSAGKPLDARVLASTDRNLTEDVRAGSFSRELYDALSVITLRLPPLRDRRDDIPLLVRHFIQRFNEELDRSIKGVADDVSTRLQEHPWPGNVGELERVIKRACIVARSDVITLDEIAERLGDARFERQDVESALARTARTALHERLVERSAPSASSPFHEIVDLVEVTLVQEALTITNGNQVKAAEILGVNRATLRKKMPADR